MSNRNEHDVRWGGLVGILLAVIVAGGLPLLSVAGAHVLFGVRDYHFDSAIAANRRLRGNCILLVRRCFRCTHVLLLLHRRNSLCDDDSGSSPNHITMVGAVIAALLAITGVAANLVGLFTIIGASFGPICGAMAADFLLSGKKWAGPRQGVNIAGYAAWAVGFVIGILPFLPISEDTKPYLQPAAVYSFIAGFIVYAVWRRPAFSQKLFPKPRAPENAVQQSGVNSVPAASFRRSLCAAQPA